MIDYTIDPAQRLITVRVHGHDNTCEQFEQVWEQMGLDRQFDGAFHHLTLMDRGAGGPFETHVLHFKSTLEMSAQKQINAKKWAIVIPETWKRAAASLIFQDARLGWVQMRFFATEAEAREWVNSKS